MTIPRSEHPRPDFVREPWLNLNGEWEFAFDDRDEGEQNSWATKPLPEKIIVPFSFQSPRSGIGDPSPHPICWYRRSFELPLAFNGLGVRLVFGAVDYEAKVWVNGQFVGSHKGGYVPFGFDITHAVKKGENWIAVRVKDTESKTQPRGKQSCEVEPSGIFYTRCSGIWQSVWLEGMGDARIDSVQILPDTDTGQVAITAWVEALPGEYELVVTVAVPEGGPVVSRKQFSVTMGSAQPTPVRMVRRVLPMHLWSPDKPALYDMRVELRRGHITPDRVKTYFGFRKVEVRPGVILLNDSPCFLRFALDQGYFPEGIYSPASDADLRRDIEKAKALGFNGVRKHQKVEDPRYLYWADKLGFLVWEEMPSFFEWSAEGRENFTREWAEVLRRDRNHPCIIAWVPFNESWGVRDVGTDEEQQAFVESICHLTKSEDPARPVADNSGWEHVKADIFDIHDYTPEAEVFARNWKGFSPAGQEVPGIHKRSSVEGRPYAGQPVVISEYGGIALEAFGPPGGRKIMKYGNAMPTEQAFLDRYKASTLAILEHPGLCGFCYTQLYDIEQEVNGLLTFDRKPKVDVAAIAAINKSPAAIEQPR